MASVNKAIVLGNLGRDPELRHTSSGAAVANFSIATSDRYQDKSGEWQERTEWHRIVVFGRQAENCAKYLAKGRTAYVEGRIQSRDWEDKDGNKRTSTEVVAQTVQFIGGRDGGGGGGGRYNEPPPPDDNYAGSGGGGNAGSGGGSGGGAPKNDDAFSDDEIPF
ncbi:MAG: single-strand DNA-binding protein [Flavobacteriales bacterium]|jgi:single-strand DNA-binding protein